MASVVNTDFSCQVSRSSARCPEREYQTTLSRPRWTPNYWTLLMHETMPIVDRVVEALGQQVLAHSIAGGMTPQHASRTGCPRHLQVVRLTVQHLAHPICSLSFSLPFQCASVLVMRLHSPEHIHEIHKESIAAPAVSSRWSTKSTAVARGSMSSATGEHQTTRSTFVSQLIERVDECTVFASIKRKPLMILTWADVLLYRLRRLSDSDTCVRAA